MASAAYHPNSLLYLISRPLEQVQIKEFSRQELEAAFRLGPKPPRPVQKAVQPSRKLVKQTVKQTITKQEPKSNLLILVPIAHTRHYTVTLQKRFNVRSSSRTSSPRAHGWKRAEFREGVLDCNILLWAMVKHAFCRFNGCLELKILGVHTCCLPRPIENKN